MAATGIRDTSIAGDRSPEWSIEAKVDDRNGSMILSDPEGGRYEVSVTVVDGVLRVSAAGPSFENGLENVGVLHVTNAGQWFEPAGTHQLVDGATGLQLPFPNMVPKRAFFRPEDVPNGMRLVDWRIEDGDEEVPADEAHAWHVEHGVDLENYQEMTAVDPSGRTFQILQRVDRDGGLQTMAMDGETRAGILVSRSGTTLRVYSVVGGRMGTFLGDATIPARKFVLSRPKGDEYGVAILSTTKEGLVADETPVKLEVEANCLRVLVYGPDEEEPVVATFGDDQVLVALPNPLADTIRVIDVTSGGVSRPSLRPTMVRTFAVDRPEAGIATPRP